MMARSYWAVSTFPNYQFDWNAWGDLIFTNPILPRNVKGHHVQIFHGLLYLESKLRHFKHKDGTPYSNGLCTWCKTERESHMHLLTCQYRRSIWTMLEKIIERAFDINFPLNELRIRAGYFDLEHSYAMKLTINMILAISRYHIYLNRNTIKNENVTISFQECYLKLKYYLLNHISLLQMSNTTRADVKEILPSVVNSIEFFLRKGLNENDISNL